MSVSAAPRRPRLRLPGGLEPFGYRDFALFWIGWATTRFGRGVEETGAVWLMYELTGSPVLLGLLGLSRAVPAILLGAIAGAVADRVDQRRVLFLTQLLGGVTSLAVGLLVLTGRIEFWHLYVQVAIHGSIEAFDGGARLALFPRLVPRHLLAESVTMNSAASRTSQLLGPLVGGVTIAALGEAAPFIVNAATFLVLMAAVAAMRPLARVSVAAGTSLLADLRDGLRYVRRAPAISGLLKLEVVVGTVQINAVIITLVGRQILGVGPEGLGGLLAAPALGALLALGGLLVFGHPERQGRFILACGLGYAGAMASLAASPAYALTFAGLSAIGVLDALMTVTRHSVIQLAAPGEMRGRVMGVMGTITRGVSPLGEMQSGAVAGAIGPGPALVVAGGALAVATAATALGNRRLWEFRRDTPVVPTEPEPGVAPSDAVR